LIEGIEGFRVELGVDDLSETGAAVDFTEAVAWADPDTRTTAINRGDGVPDDAFLSCTTAAPCSADALMNLTAVRFYVLARGREASQGHTDTKTYDLGTTTLGPFGDAFQRHVFMTTVRLPNISGRRLTP
jgi:type IV pilus assembly protein PilW